MYKNRSDEEGQTLDDQNSKVVSEDRSVNLQEVGGHLQVTHRYNTVLV